MAELRTSVTGRSTPMARTYNDLKRVSPPTSNSDSGTSPDGSHKPLPRRQKGTKPHVAIIGAGVAGLRCADVLIRSGAQVTIFEARDQIGGRVRQCKTHGKLLDIGANWIHGSKDNPIIEIARKTSTVLHEPDEEMAIFDSTGNQIDSKVAAEISEVVWDMVAKAFQYSEDNLDNIDKNRSLMDFFREHLPEIVKDPKRRALVLQEAHVWGSVIGDSISRQSLKCFFLEECIGGQDTFVAKTYEKILAEIAAMALSHANIQFNEEVIFLDTPTSYEPNASSTPQTIVHTRSGKRQTFNEVVITAPLGWLKRNARKLFRKEAPLPPRLLRAIDNLGYGRLEKVYVAFPTSFWHASKDSRFTATFASSRSEASRAVSVPASSTLLQSGASIEYPFLTHFHNPKYIQHPSNVAWDQSMVNLAALPEPTAQPTLLFYLYGDCGTHLLSLISKERTATHPPQTLSPPSSHAHHNKGDRTYSILLSFFKPYYSRLPGYLDNKAACQPSFFVTTNWQKDPCAGHGSYTNFPVGLARGDRDIKVLRSGGVEQEAVKPPRTAKVDSSSPVANKDKSAASCGKDGRKTKIDTRSTPENKANTDPPRNLGDIEASRGVGFTRGVWLSGEHTAPLIATGTTTGAYWSGEQAAARLLRLYGIDCKKYLT